MFTRLRFGVPLALLVLGTMLFAGTQDTAATDDSDGPRTFAADERVKATAPAQPLGLAQPTQIALNLTDASVEAIGVIERNNDRRVENRSSGVAVGSGDAKVVQNNGLTKTIEIVPVQVGVLDIDVLVLFADGGVGRKSYRMNVVPNSKGLKKFCLSQSGHALTMVLEEKEDRRTLLSPVVYYEQLDNPVFLADASQIKFTVDQPKRDPVIRLDSNGMVHALRPGEARIIADFDGVQDVVVVNVYTKDDAPLGYRHCGFRTCRD